jgi:hypothetical protein
MRIITVLILMFSMQLKAQANEIDLDDVRFNYNKATSDKKLCSQMIEGLKSMNDPVYIAYLGGLQMIWASHILNPFAKLNTFNEGKENIERAILKEPQNPELRFIRLSVQKKAPRFLGYTSMIKDDIEFIKTHKGQITSNIVLSNLDKLLKD